VDLGVQFTRVSVHTVLMDCPPWGVRFRLRRSLCYISSFPAKVSHAFVRGQCSAPPRCSFLLRLACISFSFLDMNKIVCFPFRFQNGGLVTLRIRSLTSTRHPSRYVRSFFILSLERKVFRKLEVQGVITRYFVPRVSHRKHTLMLKA
jgi:hypothetical protein